MTFPILASLLVRLVVLLPFQLLRLSLATPSRWTPLALSVLDRKSGSAGMPRPISYAVFCLKKKKGVDEALQGVVAPGSEDHDQEFQHAAAGLALSRLHVEVV